MLRKAILVFFAFGLCSSTGARINQVLPLDKPCFSKGTSITPNKDSAPIIPRDDLTKVVNERYPSAALFGRTCGGTIISDKWVLSAAHCTLFTSGHVVLAGTNNTDDGTGVQKLVKKLYIHPRFSVGPYWLNANSYGIKQVAARWDFLLVELEEPLTLDGKVLAAAPLDDLTYHSPGETVGFAGFGAAKHGEVMRSKMHAIDMQMVSDDKCAKLVEYDAEDMLCATGRPPKNETACNGDSGSGLIDEAGKLIGVASWVENDAFECFNGAQVYFSRVSAARPWIKEITGL